MKINFQKQFGKGTDPWYAKAERWVKKKFIRVGMDILNPELNMLKQNQK